MVALIIISCTGPHIPEIKYIIWERKRLRSATSSPQNQGGHANKSKTRHLVPNTRGCKSGTLGRKRKRVGTTLRANHHEKTTFASTGAFILKSDLRTKEGNIIVVPARNDHTIQSNIIINTPRRGPAKKNGLGQKASLIFKSKTSMCNLSGLDKQDWYDSATLLDETARRTVREIYLFLGKRQ